MAKSSVAIEKSKALTLIPIERSVDGEPEPDLPGVRYIPASYCNSGNSIN
jgi:hypothetical protein